MIDLLSVDRERTTTTRQKLTLYRWVGALIVVAGLTSHPARAGEPCQNQLAIDTCKLGCSATEAVCGGLCDAGNGFCWVACEGTYETCDFACDACDTGCDVCCLDPTGLCDCAGCRSGCNDCHQGCTNARNSCHHGCQLDCDDCILNCERDCESICVPFRKVGEFCTPLIDRCADELICWPIPFPGELRQRCFPSDNDELIDDDTCRSFYSHALHEGAMDLGGAMSYGTGGSAAIGGGLSQEVGVVYSPDNRFGCYTTYCFGLVTDVSTGIYAGVGLYIDYESFRGESVAFVKTAGKGVNFSTSQIFSTNFDLIGTADALSLGIGILPFDVGAFDCVTVVDTVGEYDPATGALIPVFNSAPLARCADRVVCADPESCTAEADVNNDSTDPDGDMLTFIQDPQGPYEIGERTVELNVTDPEQSSDQCEASVTVNDCTAPAITCPPTVDAACDGPGGTRLDPGNATAVDCTTVSIDNPGENLFPVGTTSVLYTATDEAGNTSSCETKVTITDMDAPVLGEVIARPGYLWPPDHQMREVTLEIEVSDVCDPAVTCEIVSVSIDEAVLHGNGGNDGAGDVEIMSGTTLKLRAERAGNSDGRVYIIVFTCVDQSGNTVEDTTSVLVPHDLGDIRSDPAKRARESVLR